MTFCRWLAAQRSAFLTVSGLGCLTAGAWSLATPAGFAVAGISLLIIDFLSTPEETA